jgi:hypothetical protein
MVQHGDLYASCINNKFKHAALMCKQTLNLSVLVKIRSTTGLHSGQIPPRTKVKITLAAQRFEPLTFGSKGEHATNLAVSPP